MSKMSSQCIWFFPFDAASPTFWKPNSGLSDPVSLGWFLWLSKQQIWARCGIYEGIAWHTRYSCEPPTPTPDIHFIEFTDLFNYVDLSFHSPAGTLKDKHWDKIESESWESENMKAATSSETINNVTWEGRGGVVSPPWVMTCNLTTPKTPQLGGRQQLRGVMTHVENLKNNICRAWVT